MKIADRVKINESGDIYYGEFGILSYAYPNKIWQIILDRGIVISTLESNLILENSIINFKVGDQVTVINPKLSVYNEYGTVEKINNYGTLTYTIKFNNPIRSIYGYRDADLKLNTIPLTPNTTSTFGSNIKITYDVSSDPMYWTGSKTSTKSSGCSHNWRLYFGLQEKYEYCESCNAKRDTDRWS